MEERFETIQSLKIADDDAKEWSNVLRDAGFTETEAPSNFRDKS